MESQWEGVDTPASLSLPLTGEPRWGPSRVQPGDGEPDNNSHSDPTTLQTSPVLPGCGVCVSCMWWPVV